MTSSKACDILLFQALFQAYVDVISCVARSKLHPWESQLSKLWFFNVAVSRTFLPDLDVSANLAGHYF